MSEAEQACKEFEDSRKRGETISAFTFFIAGAEWQKNRTDTSRSFEHFEKVIQQWQFAWMKEGETYHDRALGVDANMKHDLAKMLVEAEKVSAEGYEPACGRCLARTEKACTCLPPAENE